jgi:peroxiredoxin family protein
MNKIDKPVRKVLIVVSRGSLEGVYPGLIMANGARMEGIEASMFFTFFGLNALVKKTLESLKVATVGNAALNMAMPMLGLPMTMPFPTWMGAIPGVSAFATGLMKKEMEKLDIPPIGEFLELISDSGGKLYGCKLAMDMFKLEREDLHDRVDGILTVGQFYEEAAGDGSHIIFT